MSHGGARNRSGPPPDPKSGRSDRRGLSFTQLPNEGYRGEIPEYPAPAPSGRVLELWESLWRRPQAAAWARQPWRWDAIAELARLQERAEADDCPVAVYDKLRQWRADLGLTPAGLIENGWQIAAVDIEPADADADDGESDDDEEVAPRRLTRVSGA